jgi:Lsr2
MKELKLVLSDDLTFAETGRRVPADETVVLSIGGIHRELDLTEEHAKELREFLEPYLNAGHMPGGEPPVTDPAGNRIKRPTPELIKSRHAMKKVRDWADAQGMRSEDGKRPAYRTESGGYYYPYSLMKAYEAHLEEKARRHLPGASHE